MRKAQGDKSITKSPHGAKRPPVRRKVLGARAKFHNNRKSSGMWAILQFSILVFSFLLYPLRLTPRTLRYGYAVIVCNICNSILSSNAMVLNQFD